MGIMDHSIGPTYLEQDQVSHLAALVTHEEMVESGANPGSQTGGHVGPGQPGDGELGPRQHPGDAGADEDDREEVGEDVDGLIVPVGQAGDATQDVHGGTVVRVDILVKPATKVHCQTLLHCE